MITLKTLEYATSQQVFDQIVNHLRKQGKPSMDKRGNECLYRGPNGLKCAAGCLIADDEYIPEMDNNPASDTTWQYLVDTGVVPPHFSELIIHMQHLHDGEHPEDWETEFEKAAQTFDLEYKKP